MTILLGVDVGGTKTHALLHDLQSGQEALGVAPGGNWEEFGLAGMLDSLRIAIDQAGSRFGAGKNQPAAAAFGLAGFDWDCDRRPISKAIESLNLGCPFVLENDGILPLWAAVPDGFGIAVSAGTGNNVRGRWHNDRSGRITGNSVRNGEFGGASELVFLAMQRLSYIWIQRAQGETVLTAEFCQLTGASDLGDLLEGIIRERYQILSSAAPIILEAAQDGDSVALEVVKRNAQELALSVLGVARQLQIEQESFPLVMSGSMLQKSPYYQELFTIAVRALLPEAQIELLKEHPVRGALKMAARLSEGKSL